MRTACKRFVRRQVAAGRSQTHVAAATPVRTCSGLSIIVVSGLLLALAAWAQAAGIDWRVRIEDPSNRYTHMHAIIESTTIAAGRDWSSHLEGSGTVEVVVRFADVATANGGGRVAAMLGRVDGIRLYEFGPQTVIRTGTGPSYGRDDLRITLGYDYMDNNFWWDPDPYARTAPVPFNKLDAYSTLVHEIGHGLGFSGWRDRTTGLLPADYMSTYDQWVFMEEGVPYFGGPHASAVYGGPVPLTVGNLMHYGNQFPLPGWELAEDVALMNGVRNRWAFRRSIGDLDLAILQDLGYTLVPEPASQTLLVLAMLAICSVAIARSHRADRRLSEARVRITISQSAD